MNRCIKVKVRLFYARAASGHIAEIVQITFSVILLFYLVTTPSFISKIKDSVYMVNLIRTNSKDITKKSAQTAGMLLPPLPDLEVQDGVWQPVAGTKSVYVFSAYAELRVAALVRVIAVSTTFEPDPLLCRIWLPEGSVFTVKARLQPLRQTYTYNHAASFVVCLPRTPYVQLIARNLDGAVLSVITHESANMTPTNLLPVLLTRPERRKQKDIVIHVCVEPVHKYSQDDWLMEWFEFNRLLNVTHFYMYTEFMSPRMKKIVSHYRDQGLITERPWDFPIKTNESRMASKLAAINDCLYRCMEKTRWMLLLSIDQLVIPRKVSSLTDLITRALSRHKRSTAFLIQNVFFYRDWQDDPEYKPDELQLVTLRKTKRTSNPDLFYQNNKLIVLPHKVVEIGTNYVTEILPPHKSYGSVAMPPRLALLHNYQRKCSVPNCLHVNTTIDRLAYDWKEKLCERINAEKSRFSLKIPKSIFYQPNSNLTLGPVEKIETTVKEKYNNVSSTDQLASSSRKKLSTLNASLH